jgi:hypothetical protein
MIRTPRSTRSARARHGATTLTLAAALLWSLPTATAAELRVDASSVPFADGVDLAGVDLAWDDGLVLRLGAEGGALGDAVVPDYDAAALPTDALGRVRGADGVSLSGVASAYPGGVVLTHAGRPIDALVAAYAERLATLGFAVDARVGERSFAFERAGETYRAVFGAAAEGVAVYLGR